MVMSSESTEGLTFVFTDVEGSTAIWDSAPEAAAQAMAEHDRLLRQALADWDGTFVKGTGDGALAVFETASNALAAAVDFQLAWGELTNLAPKPTVRVALHTGPAVVRRNDYYGLAPTQCARVLSAIHGGQVCLTDDTCAAVGEATPPHVELRDLGEHRLRGITEPVRIFQATHPRLPVEFPPLRAVEAFHHNLPAALTSFVGRTDELAEAEKLLHTSRLLTVAGAGGSGKSRLALAVASKTLDDFPDGVWLVELAPLRDPKLIARTIGNALGLPEEPGRDDLSALVARLADQEMLLVLDNCDHLVQGSADVAKRILSDCPRVRIIATTRQRLGVAGEATFKLSPMTVPSLDDLDDPVLNAKTDSVRLFLERASLADPDFTLTAENSRAVGQICRLVDGIPLAIELAAGRIASLAPGEIAARLGDQIGMLTGGTGEQRHQTLEHALEWSYSTLDHGERDLLADLSVFRGGFQLDAAEDVCHIATFAECVQGVSNLVDKSMLTRDRASGRFRYLEPIRLYAREKLAATDREFAIRERHATYFAGLVEPAGSDPLDQSGWTDRVSAEQDNIRAALGWSMEHDRGDLALRIVAAVWPYWKHAGHVAEGRVWLERSIEAAGGSDPAALESALHGAGALAATQDDLAPAEAYFTRALALAEERGDDVAATTMLAQMASLPHRAGDPVEATQRFQEALDRARRGGDLPQTASILASLALLKEDQGLGPEAEQHATEAVNLRRRTNDPYAVADALLTLGEISINRGRNDEARLALDEALDIASGSGFQDITAWATAYLGKLESAQGNNTAALRRLEDALGQFQQRGQPNGEVWTMRHLGEVAVRFGDLERAAALLRDALDLSLEHVVPDAPGVLLAMGELNIARGDYAEAAYLIGVAKGAQDRMSLVSSPADAARAAEVQRAAEAQLGTARLGELTDSGASSSLDDLPPLLVGTLRR
jgi:predicted ATPase/class 3 adenylate cyclase